MTKCSLLIYSHCLYFVSYRECDNSYGNNSDSDNSNNSDSDNSYRNNSDSDDSNSDSEQELTVDVFMCVWFFHCAEHPQAC